MLSKGTKTSVRGSNSWVGGERGALTMSVNMPSSLSINDALPLLATGVGVAEVWLLVATGGAEFCVGRSTGEGAKSASSKDCVV
jgi:hypothetical protein